MRFAGFWRTPAFAAARAAARSAVRAALCPPWEPTTVLAAPGFPGVRPAATAATLRSAVLFPWLVKTFKAARRAPLRPWAIFAMAGALEPRRRHLPYRAGARSCYMFFDRGITRSPHDDPGAKRLRLRPRPRPLPLPSSSKWSEAVVRPLVRHPARSTGSRVCSAYRWDPIHSGGRRSIWKPRRAPQLA